MVERVRQIARNTNNQRNQRTSCFSCSNFTCSLILSAATPLVTSSAGRSETEGAIWIRTRVFWRYQVDGVNPRRVLRSHLYCLSLFILPSSEKGVQTSAELNEQRCTLSMPYPTGMVQLPHHQPHPLLIAIVMKKGIVRKNITERPASQPVCSTKMSKQGDKWE